MQDIMGGFFGLELPVYNNFPYEESPCCAFVNSGRAAFECLLQNMPRPARVWVPRFICNTVLEALEHLGISVCRYSCDAQLAPELPEIGGLDMVLLVNYFGLTEPQILAAAARYPGQCIIDATTALYSPPPAGVPVFYSPRKFCGVADGGVAHAPLALTARPEAASQSATASLYLLERLESGAAAAMEACEQAERRLSGPPRRMSRLTRCLLRSIDFQAAAQARLRNYAILHEGLKSINRLELPDQPLHAPMCYPFVCGIPGMRDALIDAGIALPLYWPEVIEATDAHCTENQLARQLLPLPLDQRYSEKQIKNLLDLILN